MPIKVLVVDDSATVRQLITRMLSVDPDIEVVGEAQDPYVARDKIVELNPDVLTLDIEMPRMDGLTFLKILMEQKPLPVIVISSLTQAGSSIALEALRIGAIDVLAKPGSAFTLGDVGPQLIEKIKAAAISKRIKYSATPAPRPTASKEGAPSSVAKAPRANPFEPVAKPTLTKRFHERATVLLGASTGGTEALREVLVRLPADTPPIFIVQHIPPHFSKAFADRLNQLCQFKVKEAQSGDRALPGHAYVAPGDYHMTLQWSGSLYTIQLKKGPMIWHQRPAVDVMFDSAVAAGAAEHATCAVLTGMGRDGADGLLKLRQNGALTFAQTEETCVVYGMPKACHENGAAQKMVPLDQMHTQLERGFSRFIVKQ